AAVIAVPIAAQLACQPVILLLDAALPTYGVPANVLAAPAAPIATVLGLLACVLLAVAPPLGVMAGAIAWGPATWIAAVAETLAAAPFARLPWPGGVGGLALLVAVTGLIIASLVLRGRARTRAVVLLVVVAVAYGGIAGGMRIRELAGRPHNWHIAACDVGQ